MKRRTVLLATGALASGLPAFAPTVLAQQPFRIGLPFRESSPESRARLQAAFRKHGWTYGRDYEFVQSDVAPNHRQEEIGSVIAKRPDLLLVFSTAQAREAQRHSATLPVVMYASGYPVEMGVANSLARPGRNVTGNTVYVSRGRWGKLAQLLVEIKPGTRRIGLLWGYRPGYPKEFMEAFFEELTQAEAALGVRIHRVDVDTPEQLPGALAAVDATKPQALILTSGPVLGPARQQLMEYAESRRLPTIIEAALPPEYKGLRPLLAYGPILDDLLEQAVEYVVRILRDRARPSELPIRLPAKFELVIYNDSAARIGLTIPQSLLLRADRVIE